MCVYKSVYAHIHLSCSKQLTLLLLLLIINPHQSLSTQLRLYYLPALRPMLTTPLKEREKDGIEEVVQAMHAYCLSKDDFEFLLDVTKFKTAKPWGADPYKDVPTAVKSAFTRMLNATQGPVKCSAMLPDVTKVKGRRSRGDEGGGDEVDAVPGEGVMAEASGQEPGAAEQEEDDIDVQVKMEKMQRALAKRGVQVSLKDDGKGSKGSRGGSKGSKGRGSGGRSSAAGSGRGRGRGRGSK